MRMLIMAIMFALLASCSTIGGVTAQAVADWVKANCNGFIVVVSDVAELIKAEPAVTDVIAFGKQICDAINAKQVQGPGASSSGSVVVNGVTIHYSK